MRERGNLRVLLTVSLIVWAVMVCGTVFAYMFKQTEYKDNQFAPAEVSCLVSEQTDANVTKKTSIKVQNTGNIAAYIRVRLVSYWVQAAESGSTQIAAKASQMPEFEPAAGWIKGTNDTYYYQDAVAPGGFTGELLSTNIILQEDGAYLQVVEVFAEAIQSEPDTAAQNSWQVVLNDNGRIVAVP